MSKDRFFAPASDPPTRVGDGFANGNVLPHTLLVAYQRLAEILRDAIDQYNRNRRFSNSSDVCAAIERLVDEFRRVPAWEAELKRRAVFVEEQCAQGSAFRRVLDKAYSRYRSQPRRAVGPEISGAKLAIWLLRRPADGVVFSAQVVEVRHDVECGIREGIFGIRVKAAFEELLEECRRIQHEGERLEVDGCFYLYHVHLASKPSPPNTSKCVKALMESDTGGVDLESMKAAADSLVAWTRENLAATVKEVGSTGARRVDEPQGDEAASEASSTVPRQDTKLIADLIPLSVTEAAKYIGVTDRTIREWRGNGKLTAVEDANGQLLFSKSTLEILRAARQ